MHSQEWGSTCHHGTDRLESPQIIALHKAPDRSADDFPCYSGFYPHPKRKTTTTTTTTTTTADSITTSKHKHSVKPWLIFKLSWCHNVFDYFASLTLKAPIKTATDNKFWDIFSNFQKKIRHDISWESSTSRRFSWNIMPYLLFLKKQQNLKVSSAANYRWRFKG